MNNRKFLFLFLFFFLVPFSSALVENAVFSMDYNLTSIDNQSTSLSYNYVGEDYQLLYVLGDANNMIYEFNVTSEFNLTSISYTNVNFSVAGETTSPSAFSFIGLGTRFYVADGSGVGTTVYEYAMSSWDITTATLTRTSVIPSMTGTIRDIWMSNDGLSFMVQDCRTSPTPTSCRINKYNMTSAFNLDTASLESSYVQFSGGAATNPTRLGFWFDALGTVLYTTNRQATGGCSPCDTNTRVRQFDLSSTSTFNLSSPDEVSDLSVGTTPSARKPVLKQDESVMWLLFETNNMIYQYIIPPERTAEIPNVNMPRNFLVQHDFSTYFEGYDYVALSVTDFTSGENIFVDTGSQTMIDGVVPLIRVTVLNDVFTLESQDVDRTFSATAYACIDSSLDYCATDTFIINVSASFTSANAPYIVSNFQNSYNLLCTGSNSFFMSNYFGNFTSIRINYVDAILNESVVETVTVGTPATVINNGTIYSQLDTYQQDIILTIASTCNQANIPFQVTAINTNGQISQTFQVVTATSGSPVTPPSAPSGWIGSLITILEGVYPEADSLTIFQKMIYVFMTMILVSMVLIGIGFLLGQGINTNNSAVAGAVIISFVVLTVLANVLMFFFFIAIGYINVLIPIVIIIGIIGLIILRIRMSSN